MNRLVMVIRKSKPLPRTPIAQALLNADIKVHGMRGSPSGVHNCMRHAHEREEEA